MQIIFSNIGLEKRRIYLQSKNVEFICKAALTYFLIREKKGKFSQDF